MNRICCAYCGTCLTAVMFFMLDMLNEVNEEGFSVQMLEVQDMLPL